jgi:hypothetical protein
MHPEDNFEVSINKDDESKVGSKRKFNQAFIEAEL